MPRQLLICIKEREHARRLAEYIAGQKDIFFRVNYCADAEKAVRLSGTIRPDYLLLDDAFTPEERDRIAGDRRFVLSEEMPAIVGEGETAIFKYAPGSGILREMTEHSLDDAGITGVPAKERVKVIGFYSPVKRVGQTTLALAIGGRLAREDGTLYLNLCAHAGGGHFDGEEGSSLDQFLYFLEQDAPNTGLRLKKMAAQKGEMDYLRPVEHRDDLEAIGAETWTEMIGHLRKKAPYGYVLLDIGDSVRGIRGILKACDLVYMPVAADDLAAAKVNAFSRELKTAGEAEMIRKIRKVTMNRETDVIADSCARAIQAEGTDRGPARRDQGESA